MRAYLWKLAFTVLLTKVINPSIGSIDPNLATFFMLFIAASIFTLLYFLGKTKTAIKVREKATTWYRKLVSAISQSPIVIIRYTVEEKSKNKYIQAIKEQIKNSKRIYFRLLSGHTMFYEEEMFIRDVLNEMPQEILRKKDIKIQLLDRQAPSFSERANKFVADMWDKNLPHRITYEEYIKRCMLAEKELISLLGSQRVTFYKRKYLWRLHIFDERIFISTYYDDPKLIIEGHKSPSYSFNRECDVSLFDGFLEEFNSLYRKHP